MKFFFGKNFKIKLYERDKIDFKGWKSVGEDNFNCRANEKNENKKENSQFEFRPAYRILID